MKKYASRKETSNTIHRHRRLLALDLVSDLGVSKSYPTADPYPTADWYPAPDFFDDELIFDGVFDGVTDGAFDGVFEGVFEGVIDGAFDGALDTFDDTWLTLSLGRTGSSNLLLFAERLLLALEWNDATDWPLLFEVEDWCCGTGVTWESTSTTSRKMVLPPPLALLLFLLPLVPERVVECFAEEVEERGFEGTSLMVITDWWCERDEWWERWDEAVDFLSSCPW